MKDSRYLDFNKIKIGDWIQFNHNDKSIITKVDGKIKHALIIDVESPMTSLQKENGTRFQNKNFNAIGVQWKKTGGWFRVKSVAARKILDAKDTGNLKSDLAIKRYIKLKGLDK